MTILERNCNSLNGTDFGKTIINTTGDQHRDDIFYNEIMNGNFPDFMRDFAPITIVDGNNTLKYFVSGDVISVGSNEDYLRISINAKTGKKICNALDCFLPTKKISDDIWKFSDLKLIPRPMLASPNMVNTQTLIMHNEAINKQINGANFTLLSGHKKDIVNCKHLLLDNSKVAIYGWHLNGGVIQGLNSTSHNAYYEDYSQSCRLVSRNAIFNDKEIDMYDVLNNPNLCHLISDEGNYDASNIYS